MISSGHIRVLRGLLLVACLRLVLSSAQATPANRAALERHYDRFLPRALGQCRTCHLPSDRKMPESLDEFPHNPFGDRLRRIGEEAKASGTRLDLGARLAKMADEDSDGDGVANQAELLLGHNPGEPKDTPGPGELETLAVKASGFSRFLTGYRWQPFEPVVRPKVPTGGSGTPGEASPRRVGNPIDAFLSEARAERGLKERPEASREVLLRRVFMDLVGLNPTPEEQRQFLADSEPGSYERLVERLLSDPRHGERWARHWMDVWRYSDWAGWADGNQVRDSKPHIWHWRDWIVEALNSDMPYNRMVTEMLAADEVAPEDPAALRATGYLVRNYKMLSREQWLEDTVKHTFQAFLGVTMGCAKCHDHMVDPISQREYYSARAIFEPHQVRTDRVPGELDTARDGLPRAYDSTNSPTFLLVRGDERHPLTNQVMVPDVPAFLGGKIDVREVKLSDGARRPDHREFVLRDTLAASGKVVEEAVKLLETTQAATNAVAGRVEEARIALDLAYKKRASLEAVIEAERARDSGLPTAGVLATNATLLQRMESVAQARLQEHKARLVLDAAATNKQSEARQKLSEASQQLAKAVDRLAAPLDSAFVPRTAEVYPPTSSGRRSAFARWITARSNPLTARVAVNHVWMRHFGQGLVPSVADFGRNGRPATHPALLDWLAAEFMEPTGSGPGGLPQASWSFRHLHRLILTSRAYRMASTSDDADLERDPDNLGLWRMNSRRLEAEAVRDNLLHVAGSLDGTMGGADVDHLKALTSRRRSLYLRHASEKQAEFLQIFDGPGVTECYQRRPSVIPQQALALGNSSLALEQARLLAARLTAAVGDSPERLVAEAFSRVLGRRPTPAEERECLGFLNPAQPVSNSSSAKARQRAVENLVLVLFNHSDFVTIR
jgi:hypothetical protein